MMDKRMDHMGSLRRIVFILLLWTVSLTLAVAIAAAESLSFLDGHIRFYPAQREGDHILIPFAQPPTDNEEVLLLGHQSDLISLKRLQKGTIKPQSMAHPRPHYVYGLTEGQLSSTRAQFLVAVGKGITPLLKWQADDAMSGKRKWDPTDAMNNGLLAQFSAGPMSSMPDNAKTSLSLEDIKSSSGPLASNQGGPMSGQQLAPSSCMTPDNGFAITALQVLMSKELNTTVYYLQEESLRQEEILQSTPDMIFDEGKASEASMKEVVGIVESENSCHVLAYNTSDGYGLQNSGSSEPVGPISGIVELSMGRSTERWLVLRSAMREVWGYTFIELPSKPLNREPKRRFLLEDRG
ncbi:MAG: hypothetical protein OJF51_000819 [Nitrospira sp.]|jgi:hypothetical protein|nr:MAG: hypothetical protein OJF51_000819 [Nitrospira sp.]